MVESTIRGVIVILIKDLAEKSGIVESTIRFYINKFPEFMEYQLEGRRKHYAAEVVEIIQYIRDKYAENWTAEQIRKSLRQKYSQIPQISLSAEKKQEQLVPLQEQQALLAALMAQNSMLMEKILNFEQRITEVEKTQQKHNTELRTDFQKLAGDLYAGQRTVLEMERELYLNRIQALEEQNREQQQTVLDRLELRERAVREAITAWREAAVAAKEEKKKPWWKFWTF